MFPFARNYCALENNSQPFCKVSSVLLMELHYVTDQNKTLLLRLNIFANICANIREINIVNARSHIVQNAHPTGVIIFLVIESSLLVQSSAWTEGPLPHIHCISKW
jgi:hypothetical protein